MSGKKLRKVTVQVIAEVPCRMTTTIWVDESMTDQQAVDEACERATSLMKMDRVTWKPEKLEDIEYASFKVSEGNTVLGGWNDGEHDS